MKTGVVTYSAFSTYHNGVFLGYTPERKMKVFIHGKTVKQPDDTDAIIVEDEHGGVHVVNSKILKEDD